MPVPVKYPALLFLFNQKVFIMKTQNLPIAILSYVESVLLPEIPSSLGRWTMYAGALLKVPDMTRMIEKYSPMLKEFGAISENGDIDFGKLRQIGISAFEKVPSIELADFEFKKDDFEKFITYLSTQG